LSARAFAPVKAARKHVDEIDPGVKSPTFYKQLLQMKEFCTFFLFGYIIF